MASDFYAGSILMVAFLLSMKVNGIFITKKILGPGMFNPDPDKVYMTFGKAVIACADHLGILASMDNLLQAAGHGVDRCACGWLSNGKIEMGIPKSDMCSSLSGVTGSAVGMCNDTEALAWCKFN